MACLRSLFCCRELHKQENPFPPTPKHSPAISSFGQLHLSSKSIHRTQSTSSFWSSQIQYTQVYSFSLLVQLRMWTFGENHLTYSIWKSDHLLYFLPEHPSSRRPSGSMHHISVTELILKHVTSPEANQLNSFTPCPSSRSSVLMHIQVELDIY